MSVFFTADLHFGHERILQYHPARGSTLDEMHQRLVDGWRSVVRPRDDVWVLGDFAMGHLDDSLKYFHALPGKKHLIVGNHDGPRTRRLSWSSVAEYHEWRQKPHKAVLSHYPFLTWNTAHYGTWMLHGHSHGLLAPTNTTRMDVGVDTNPELRPWALEEIADVMVFRQYEPVDAHGGAA